MFAVIKTGGKQYVVSPEDKIKIEKIEGEAGEKVIFDEVFFTAEGNKVDVGTPKVSAKVEAEIIRQDKAKTKITFKYHSKARVMKTKGNRQRFTEVKIISIK